VPTRSCCGFSKTPAGKFWGQLQRSGISFTRFRELIVERLAKGKVEIDDMASEVNMSTKTLERRLAERNVTFSRLVEDIRCDLAKRYLADTDFRLEQIAYLVGYSEPAVLVRAFKRWTNTTPMQFRNKVH
jgi:AraC-like DNA-binding protein